ncbi:MAG: SH3-like domain-containing protein [Pseudomonadota bacterium]
MPDTFAPGTRVTVRSAFPPGHIRTPAYLRGATGEVERVLGPFGNPERLAYNLPAEKLPLYRVRFRLGDLFDGADRPDDTLEAEIFAHWLEPA